MGIRGGICVIWGVLTLCGQKGQGKAEASGVQCPWLTIRHRVDKVETFQLDLCSIFNCSALTHKGGQGMVTLCRSGSNANLACVPSGSVLARTYEPGKSGEGEVVKELGGPVMLARGTLGSGTHKLKAPVVLTLPEVPVIPRSPSSPMRDYLGCKSDQIMELMISITDTGLPKDEVQSQILRVRLINSTMARSNPKGVTLIDYDNITRSDVIKLATGYGDMLYVRGSVLHVYPK